MREAGSSPLTRGKHGMRGPLRRPLGLIPAHAGKTSPPPSDRGTTWAHPRSRGENRSWVARSATSLGSSPLTRGKLGVIKIIKRMLGLIPAHAGKTKGKAIVSFDPGAHPRSRGENAVAAIRAPNVGGSSPLTRGKPIHHDGAQEEGRLIPAHAGKTGRSVSDRMGTAAHPRSRGENTWVAIGFGRATGSSPLTRGKLAHDTRTDLAAGLIPAHAGKTYRAIPGRSSGRAHPRSRGENGRCEWRNE